MLEAEREARNLFLANIDELKKQIDALERNRLALLKQIGELDLKNIALEKTVEDLKAENEALKKQIDNIKKPATAQWVIAYRTFVYDFKSGAKKKNVTNKTVVIAKTKRDALEQFVTANKDCVPVSVERLIVQ